MRATIPRGRKPFAYTAYRLCVAAFALAFAGCVEPPAATDAGSAAPAAARPQAAVAMPDAFAARIAADVLERGGNAVDAAVAAGFSLAVTLPDAGNIGGGGFMTLYQDGAAYFLDYRETAPAAASRDMYLGADGVADTDRSQVGHLAAGTPGTVAGLWAAHQRFGTRPWAELVAPAIALADGGFVVPAPLRRAIAASRESFAGRTNFAAHFERALDTAEPFRQPELARTLERIAAAGPEDFYRGATAELLVAEMVRGGGLITAADLAGYEAVWRAPIEADWRNYRIITAPLPSSGGFGVVQLLKIRDLRADAFAGQKHNSAQYVHLKAEIEKRIFADRAAYLGDPDQTESPLAALLAPEYLERRAAEVNAFAISETNGVRPGFEGTHTTHFSVLDAAGNAVANTYTLNTDFGSGVVVEGAGFLLNNEMDDFAIAPGVPNYYGVVGSEANSIAPGKRMLSSMTPTILVENGRVRMVLGAMGGSTIFTTVYQVIANVVDFGMSAAAAVKATRVHHQLLPANLITYTPTEPLPEETVRALEDRGYTVAPHPFEFGNVQLIHVDDAGRTEAASDPRFHGQSLVLE